MEKPRLVAGLKKMAKVLPRNAVDFSDVFVCDVWCDRFDGISENEFLFALKKSAATMDYFPTIRQFAVICGLERSGTIKDQSTEIAQKIIGCVSKYGYTNPLPAENEIGPIGWVVVKNFGGWNHICETMTDDSLTTWSAQLRDSIGSVSENWEYKGNNLEIKSGQKRNPALELAMGKQI